MLFFTSTGVENWKISLSRIFVEYIRELRNCYKIDQRNHLLCRNFSSSA